MRLLARLFAFCTVLQAFQSFGQMEQYDYKREFHNPTDQWHSVTLPLDLFEKTNRNLSDIRVYGITSSKDTVEAAYLMDVAKDVLTQTEMSFKTLNTSKTDEGYYVTFEVPTVESINQIDLDFGQQNYDWSVRLEGSQDQRDWFTLADDYRILSIHNEMANFQFAKISIPNSKFRFFRLLVRSDVAPDLNYARILRKQEEEGDFQEYSVASQVVKENEMLKHTEIELNLNTTVPLSRLALEMSDLFDYYRPVQIMHCIDSVETEVGWKYAYSTLQSGILNSQGKNEFKFASTNVKKLKIVIHNQDNQPLTFANARLSGYVHKLTVRFNESAQYYLVYGNKNTRHPSYDLERFADSIPERLSTLKMGEEQRIEKSIMVRKDALFQNKMWLWGVMLVIIALLGWFSMKMIRNG